MPLNGADPVLTANLILICGSFGAPAGCRLLDAQAWREQLTLKSRTPPLHPWTGLGGGWPNEVDVRCLR